MAKSVLLTCLSPEAKEMITREVATIEDPDVAKVFEQLVEIVADCPSGQALGVEIQETQGTGQKKKRAPTPFNNYVAFCAKGGAKTLSDCAKTWRTMSDDEKARFKVRQ